jgi:glycosyltransferase involved in cell wall biosynthesis
MRSESALFLLKGKPMRILHVNHRDLDHPAAGGLEEIIHKISARWIRGGHQVTLLCSEFPGSQREETSEEGMRVLRRGDERLFNYTAPGFVKRELVKEHDIIMEHISKVPCYLPCFVREVPVTAHVPHLFGTTVFREAPWPIAAYVWLMERPLPWGYKRCPFWALSDSTANDLVERGVRRERITVVYGGVEFDYFHEYAGRPKTPEPSILYLGRLKKYKGIDLLITMVGNLRREFPNLKLFIAGKGDYEPALYDMVGRLGVQRNVEFVGFADYPSKRELLAKSWVLAYPSPKEGWGLSVIEAGSCGTPTIASNSPGLRESVRDGETGFLVPHGDIGAMAEKFRLLLRDAALRQRLAEQAIGWARRFNWDHTAQGTIEFLQRAGESFRR